MAPLSAVVLVLLLGSGGARACTSIIVGRDASTDGSIYIARNTDKPATANSTEPLFWHPARPGPATFASNPTLLVEDGNDMRVELPGPGLAYSAFPTWPFDGRSADGNASFEEAAVNSAGVAISGTETISSNNASLAADPLNTDTGITEDAVVSIIAPLPGATSARAAVVLLGEAIEEHGSAEGFGILFSDLNETWYLENAAGHGWLAQKVPADSFFVSANQGRFQTANLSDTENVLHSPGLEEFAAENGLWDPEEGQFDFFDSYQSQGPLDSQQDWVRVCILMQLYTGLDNSTCLERMPHGVPVFTQPDRKLGLLDVAQGLRDHFEGTPHDAYTNENPEEPWRPIFVLRTSISHITRTRQGLPDGLSVIQYVSQGPPALAPYVPVYKGLRPEDFPEELTTFGPEPDPVSLFWKGRRVQALVMQDFALLAPSVKEAIAEFEKDVEEVQRPAMEKAYIAAWEAGEEDKAAQLLADFTADVVGKAGDMLDEQLQQAADALGLNAVPDDNELNDMIEGATATYGLHGSPPNVFEG